MSLERLKRFGLILLVFLAIVGQALATDLRVTDQANTSVLVHDAVIDYGAFRDDKEETGIRIQQGDALVTAQWANVETLTVTGRDTAVSPPRIRIELVLKNGLKVAGTLVVRGRMKLVGKTDLGDYSIDLEKIKMIAPVQVPAGNRR